MSSPPPQNKLLKNKIKFIIKLMNLYYIFEMKINILMKQFISDQQWFKLINERVMLRFSVGEIPTLPKKYWLIA